jgi:hypothetical protein
MPKPWRIAAIAATVCGLTAATAATAGPALATQAAPSVSINVSGAATITHDVFVAFQDGKFSTATISGSVSGATSGEVAELYTQAFPFKSKPAASGKTLALNGSASQTYTFTDKPTVATRYTVRVLPSSSSTSAVATSASETVYVVTNKDTHESFKCPRPLCHETARITVKLPASAYKTESGKKIYFYLAVKLSATGSPGTIRTLKLTKATVSKSKKLSATEFQRTITFSFRIGNDAASWEFAWCSKDTESKDGVNLPGHHGCGDKKISADITYLG